MGFDLEKFKQDNKNEKFSSGSQKESTPLENPGLSEQLENVREVFELYPNLEKIGKKEEYLEYIEKIFPDSKIKNIVWHGSPNDEKFEKFDENKIGQLDGGFFGKGFYFSKTKSLAQHYKNRYPKTTGNLYPVSLNLKNPYFWKDNQKNFNYFEFIDIKNTPKGNILVDKDFELGFEQELLKKYNERYGTNFTELNDENIEYADDIYRLGIVGTELLKEKGYDGSVALNPISKKLEYVAFEPSQIHIHGSSEDIKKFKEFISQKNLIESISN